MTFDSGLALAIAGLTVCGVVMRPRGWPEAIWAVLGAAAVVLLGLLPFGGAVAAAARGLDVYLFLTGMMLLSEVARRERLFDWLAVEAVLRARGSPRRLFLLVYGVGTLVTVFMSNDATAVVLTPAVFAAASKAKLEPLPYVYVCALIANAASFVLPISNPANLVVFDGMMPALADWLARFALPSLVSIAVTYAMLRWRLRDWIEPSFAEAPKRTPLPRGAGVALAGIVITAVTLLSCSFAHIDLGLPAAAAGGATAIAALAAERNSPWPLLRDVPWSVIPLVAGLFVLVGTLEWTGALNGLAQEFTALLQRSAAEAAWISGIAVALICNLMNNLPAGLIAASTITQTLPPAGVTDAIMIAVDLGPNLSITGSLATILWLIALRRDGEPVGFWPFLRLGGVVMPPALLLAIAARLLLGT
jgi:arsenical pump membrane protein